MNTITPIVFRHPWDERFSVILRVRVDGQLHYAEPITLKRRLHKDDGREVAPVVQLTQDEAQALMDQLWGCGLRPSEGSGSAGSLAATERHLADMQKLTFKLIEAVA